MPPGLMPSSSTSSKLGMPGTEASLASEASTASGGPESSRLKLEAKTSSDLETDSGGSDEVKVYGDEDESEAAPSAGPDSHSSVDILSDLKSRLITESEQAKADVRRDYGAFIAMPFAAMSPYQHLMSSMSYAAAAGMSFPNGAPLARPPLFYGDHLSSPPPAHMAGLRPPMYLPAAAAAAAAGAPGQSPYGPYSAMEQHLAAWQHQAAMYQSGLRAASPYGAAAASAAAAGLPPPPGAAAMAAAAAANGLASPLGSRFSPSGLLGHPGLSPAQAAAVAAASAAGAGHHLPQSVKHKEHKHHKEHASPKKSKEPHIKKPLNAFMLYMKEMRPVVQAECTLKESAAINQILGRRWHSLSRDEQAKYYEKSRMERQKHLQMYPHWNARDNYRFGIKKKKRKRDRTDDPAAASMKKCRARYGLDQQDLWCRPCRRKKKCIRVQAYLDGKAAGKDGHVTSAQVTPGGHVINNNDLSKVKREGSSGGGDSDDDLDLDDMPEVGGGLDHDDLDEDEEDASPGERKSLESDEQSLTSPAGFASLPSIGSPVGSLASPQTPSNADHQAANNGFGAAADWFRHSAGSGGAFKPPVPSGPSAGSSLPPSTSAPSSAAPFNQFGMNLLAGGDPRTQYAYNGLIAAHQAAVSSASAGHGGHLPPPGQPMGLINGQHKPVGNDPRDSKNPLSISQLTTTSSNSSSGSSSKAVKNEQHAPAPMGPTGAMMGGHPMFPGNCFPGSPVGALPGAGGSEKRPLVGMT